MAKAFINKYKRKITVKDYQTETKGFVVLPYVQNDTERLKKGTTRSPHKSSYKTYQHHQRPDIQSKRPTRNR